ncbi:multidrug resistance efflux transporter family protein [Testudinibacter sp. TR-2022]|uniref:DMT family transporter n=1 Tax=Testudinibacter sp. TR-2022 TaxID=2585029 RepID=UPI001118B954|nr:multidrug resistance efflux transporter family protein [Testudinibacter sp. TR-2022]TNH04826.1 multidrug resistance efflux transporter family protein [Pasteurellaceae bacterium Phil31]TNH04406.1 multidrug resistance efflux transporter family protein [Testudinibacter sp. TR-2022]TNH12195.1 multidrug resistance efflux transporter family protein [Testudinibacter sp. TR-2022]TNH14088.1 multidrug resistance efflux transporter family protein [Testudinibacter sp. TR-2022]TNH18386.1 multidrug resis
MNNAILLGLFSSLFFAATFVLNRSMSLSGGDAWWSAALRFVFMLPMLYLLLGMRIKRSAVYRAIRQAPIAWLLWSTVGFGLFYLPLTLSADYASSWLVASSWQITIIAGILLTPLFGQAIPLRNLFFSCLIVLGIILLQIDNLRTLSLRESLYPLLLILLAAFAYPLGNRKMMVLVGNSLTTQQRVYGMVLCSMPFWLICMTIAGVNSGLPPVSQVSLSFMVALFSGVIATLLFFKATELVKHNMKQLAVIEATQAGEILFTLLGGVLLLSDPMPSGLAFAGLLIVVFGIFINGFATKV